MGDYVNLNNFGGAIMGSLLSSMTLAKLERTYKTVMQEDKGDTATALYNSIFNRRESKHIPLHRVEVEKKLESEILRRLRNGEKR